MKRYQEIEFSRHCKNLDSFLKKLQKRYPNFFYVWGEHIRYNFCQGITFEIEHDCGYILHTIDDDDFYYLCFIAIKPFQVIHD